MNPISGQLQKSVILACSLYYCYSILGEVGTHSKTCLIKIDALFVLLEPKEACCHMRSVTGRFVCEKSWSKFQKISNSNFYDKIALFHSNNMFYNFGAQNFLKF